MDALEQKLMSVTRAIEKQVDAAIDQIENLDVNDLESLRKQRLKEMKKHEAQKQEWLRIGHGQYEELSEERMFFDTIKKSKNVVVHFYTNGSERCLIVDKHLKVLAAKHIETRFVKLNAEKCPFLAENLKIKTIPSIVLVQDNVMVDKIVGFTQLGNRDDFTTEVLEWRIAQHEIIKYDGDLSTPPTDKKAGGSVASVASGRKIRDGVYNGEDDDLEIEQLDLKVAQAKSKYASTDLTAEEAAELGLDD